MSHWLGPVLKNRQWLPPTDQLHQLLIDFFSQPAWHHDLIPQRSFRLLPRLHLKVGELWQWRRFHSRLEVVVLPLRCLGGGFSPHCCFTFSTQCKYISRVLGSSLASLMWTLAPWGSKLRRYLREGVSNMQVLEMFVALMQSGGKKCIVVRRWLSAVKSWTKRSWPFPYPDLFTYCHQKTNVTNNKCFVMPNVSTHSHLDLFGSDHCLFPLMVLFVWASVKTRLGQSEPANWTLKLKLRIDLQVNSIAIPNGMKANRPSSFLKV